MQTVLTKITLHCFQNMTTDYKADNLSREERGGSVVECLTRDRGVAGSSLTGGCCVLEQDTLSSVLSLVLVQPRKTDPNMTEFNFF